MELSLTDRQRRYFEIIRSAEASGQSLADAARDAKVPVQSLYTLRYQLRKSGRAPEPDRVGNFEQLAVVPIVDRDEPIELRTELRNGRLLWLNVPAKQLATVLQALNT